MKNGMAWILALLAVTVLLCACGEKKDALEGVWTCEDEYLGTITWEFHGNGECHLSSIVEQDGTYTIQPGHKVEIDMELWDSSIEYHYEVTDSALKLDATDGTSHSYELQAK